MKKYKCDCDLCKMGQKYHRIISKLPPRQREWMDGFFNAAFEDGAELEMLRYYIEGLRDKKNKKEAA